MRFFDAEVTLDIIQLAVLVRSGSGTKFHPDRSAHGIVLELNGRKRYIFSDGHDLILDKNEIGYLPKHSNYQVEILEPGDCYAINFDLCGSAEYPPDVIRITNSAYFTRLFQSATEQWQAKESGYMLKIKSCLYELLFQLFKESNAACTTESRAIQPAVAYIQKNYLTEQIRVPYLAELCGISGTSLRKKFEKEFGIAPLQYIIQKKMMYASEMLCSDMYSVKETQFTCGYEDSSAFSRDFKRFFGCAPSMYHKK